MNAKNTLLLIKALFVSNIAFAQINENHHSPHKASFYSAILPGLGQTYNKKYWKLPILYAGVGALGYAIHFNTKYYKKYKSAYRDWIINDPYSKSYLEFIPPNSTEEQIRREHSTWFTNSLESKKQYYRRYRELSYIGMGALYVLQIVDAAVDAHFYNFSISDDLSLSIVPAVLEYDSSAIGLQLTFNIK